MSIQAVAWVLEHSMAEGHDRLVLLAIANHVHLGDSYAWPSVARISAEARCDRATVYRALHRLEESGELEIDRGGGRGKTNSYTLKGLHPATVKAPETVAGSDKTVAATHINGRSSATQNRINRKEPSRGRAREDEPTTIEYDPDTLERDADGNWFVRTSTPTPKTVTRTTMPAELDQETKAKGAQWARALRRGGEPA